MKDASVLINQIWRSSTSHAFQYLDVSVPLPHKTVQPGQFFLARITESLDPYLREPWIPVRKRPHFITVERPAGQTFHPSQVVSLLGPLGKPLTLKDGARSMLLIAHDATPASLLLLAESAIAERRAVTLVLTGTAVHYPLDILTPEIEVVRGDANGNWSTPAESFKWADQVITVAAPPFDQAHYRRILELAQSARGELATEYLRGMFHPPMLCGIGTCGACAVTCHKGERLACTEGPAFDLLDISL
jgi:NAD(P)H-flavin reductase